MDALTPWCCPNAQCMQLFIDEVASRYPKENIVMVVDGAGWHKAGSLQLPGNLRLHFLPPVLARTQSAGAHLVV
jgi:hypothetical protein